MRGCDADDVDVRAEVLAAARARAAALASGDRTRLATLLHPEFRWTSHTGEVFDKGGYLAANTGGGTSWRRQDLGDPDVAVVADAVRRIEAGDLEKVVLARDLLATAAAPIDVRWPLGRLAASYPMCWTFHVDGMFGATPEMLVRRERGLVT